MICSRTTNHVYDVNDDFLSAKEGTVHPSSPLLHESDDIRRCISECFSIGYVRQLIFAVHLDIDLETHDSVFSQVLVSFCTCRLLCPRDILEEFVKGSALDRLPSEDWVSTRQDLCKAKEWLTSLVRCVAHLVFIELCSLDQVLSNDCKRTLGLGWIVSFALTRTFLNFF